MNESMEGMRDIARTIPIAVVIMAVALFAHTAKGKTFRERVSAGRLIIVGMLAASAVGLVLVFVLLSKQASPGMLISAFALCLAVGLGVVGFVFYVFDLLPRFSRSIQDMRFLKSLRSTCIYGMCLAFVFTGFYILLLDARDYFWRGYLAGAFFGIITGFLGIGPMKERIVEGTFIRKRTVDLEFRTYWKSYLLMGSSFIISYLVASELLHSTAAFLGFIGGVFAGMVLFFFVWVLLYEKRHNVRLKIEYEDRIRSSFQS